MAKKENLLPINAIYFTWLRDYGKRNRPTARRTAVNHRTHETRTIEKTEMDMIDFMIYVSLLSRSDKDKLTCFPSINAISDDCFGIDRRTITDHLQDLEQMGYIEIKKANGKANIYVMKDFKEWLNNPRHKD
jgi:hypothetical protein